MNFGTIQVANIFVGTLNAIEAYFGTDKVWEKSEPAPTANCLCFTAKEAGSTVKLHKNGSAPDVNLQTSTDGSSWKPYTIEDVITLANVNDKVYFKAVGSNTKIGKSAFAYNNFVMAGKIASSGNVNSLLEEDEETARAMSLAEKSYCYYSMFNGCTSLTQAPELPATTLATNCYSSMFNGCSSLTQAPELPATTLASSCYNNMFNGCTSLTQAPELPATTLASSCYNRMFYGCTSLTQAPELPATTLANNCYGGMFNGCTSLTQAPELPATTLAIGCYSSMFNGCSNLNTIKLGYTGNFGDAPSNAFSNWVSNVASTGTFYYNGSDTTTGVSAIPTGWTVTPFTS